jgi:hypothetical protein
MAQAAGDEDASCFLLPQTCRLLHAGVLTLPGSLKLLPWPLLAHLNSFSHLLLSTPGPSPTVLLMEYALLLVHSRISACSTASAAQGTRSCKCDQEHVSVISGGLVLQPWLHLSCNAQQRVYLGRCTQVTTRPGRGAAAVALPGLVGEQRLWHYQAW